MKFKSISIPASFSTFRDALFRGTAPGGSLYEPESFPLLPEFFLNSIERQSFHDIALAMLSPMIDEIPAEDLSKIITKSFSFDIPLRRLDGGIFLLELFHGPTLAFKDVGARFMAETMAFFLSREQRAVTILVATSGDTGSAVAHGFLGADNIHVFVLYPSDKISLLQEKQMTTLGGNIFAIEIDGTFDDCQLLVKQLLADPDVAEKIGATTANSINLGRLLPQMTYFGWAFAQWKKKFSGGSMPVMVVPSGNVGNITAACYAHAAGIPFKKIVGVTNQNDSFYHYVAAGFHLPRRSVQSYSNAMDVGDPNNLPRIQSLYRHDHQKLKIVVDAAAVSEEETLEEISFTYKQTGIFLDPHTAVGVCAARRLQKGGEAAPLLVAATAHPAKFPDVIEKALGCQPEMPVSLTEAMKKEKKSIKISADYHRVKKYIIDQSRT